MEGKIFLYSNHTPPRITFSPDAFTFDLQRFDAVCQIGETTYESLQDAIDAAQDGNTIQMLANTNLTAIANVTKTVTIDLNGFTISRVKTSGAATSNAFNVKTADGVQGNLTIKDTSSGQTGKVTATDYTVKAGTGATNQGTFTLESGTLESTNSSGYTVQVYGGSTANIKGGTVTSKSRAISAAEGSIVNVSGGTLTSEKYAIYATSGSTVTGATNYYCANIDNANRYYTTEDAMKTEVASAYFSIGDGDDIKYFTTLTAAQSAASSDGSTVVKVIKDYSVGETTINKKWTLDLNGHTLTSTGKNHAFSLSKDSNFTVTDSSAEGTGKITNGTKVQANALIYINKDNATFTLAGGTLESITYGVRTKTGATFNMTGGVITNNAETFDYSGGSYSTQAVCNEGGTVNISGGEVSAVGLAVNNSSGSTVNISGGSVKSSKNTAVISLGGTVDVSGTAYVEGTTGIAGVNGAKITMSGGEVKSVENNGKVFGSVQLGENTADYLNKNDSFTMTGGKLSGDSGVNLFNGGETFEMSGGEINTTTFAVSNNGNSWNQDATIKITGGTLTSSGAAGIYHAGPGTTTVSDGTITGTTGIECRAGTLNVTGGTITGTDTEYSCPSNKGGSTTSGAGIAIAQHTTKKAVTVNISGNNTQISGANALAVADPEKNRSDSSSSVGKVAATISGGTFTATQSADSSDARKSGNAILANNANVEITVTDGNIDGNVTVVETTTTTNTTTKEEGKDDTTTTTETQAGKTTLKMQGGTTTGTVKVVQNEETENVTQTKADGKITSKNTETSKTEDTESETSDDSLQVTGGTYSDKTSASKYITSDVKVNEQTGEVVNAGAGWTARDSSENAYDYLVKSGGASATLLSATLGSGTDSLSSLKADAANYLIGVYEDAATATGNAADSIKSQYYFSTFKSDGTAITLTPQTAGFKIKGTTFIGDVTELTANGSTGINVDATNNKLTNITGGAGNDNLLAGDRNTTLDGGNGNNVLQGGTGNDSLKGGTGNDEFIYTAGNDTVSGFNTGDLVRTTLSAVTDGSKLTTVTNGFKLDFGNSNTLTFTDAAVPVSLSDGSSQYIYTQDLIKQGNSVTLGAGTTAFNGTTGSLTAVTAIDGSAVTGNLTITDNINNNSITFGKGKNTFNYKAGKDTITGYDSSDVVNLAAGLTAPTSFENVSYDGSNLAINFDASNILTFNTASNVSIAKDTATYSYKGHSNGGMDYIALNSASGNGISLGAQYSTVFSGTVEANANYTTIDASNGSNVVRIIGNDQSNYIVSGAKGGTISGGEGDDTITAAGVSASLTLNGGAGDDLLIGGTVYNRFEYSEGKDTISGYNDKDLINVTGRNVSFADVTVSAVGGGENNDLLISFDSDNQLSIAGGANFDNAISVTSGSRLYKFTKDYIAHNKGITLAAGYSSPVGEITNTYDGSSTDYETINAAAVSTAISVMGNSLGNYIFGATAQGGSINGGTGNDKINVSERSDGANYLFGYTSGKDEVIGFDATKDTVSVAVDGITAAKLSNGNSKLVLTVNKNKDVLTLRSEDEIEKVSLQSGGYLTKDGYVSGQGFSLFGSAKGQIDLNDALYKGSNISLVAADSVKSQGVTLTGGADGGTFIYAPNNKKRDGFVYGGGTVSISGYEAGKDRIDLGSANINSFEVKGSEVVFNVGNGGTISIAGAGRQEVLLHDTSKGNGYKKMVFAQTGVIENKQKNPTMATVSGAATEYSVPKNGKTTIKKIYVTGLGAEGVSIQAGSKNNTIIDASAAGQGVSLSGGAKNDKLIGSSDKDDLFVYSAGKDVIQGYSGGDSIKIGDFESSLSSAKITAGSKSIKFQFNNKNTLTIKANNGETLGSALTIGDTNYTYTKNAIESGGQATLTNAFSGTFDTANHKVTTVNGSAVSKNLTYKGSEAAESLVGGTKKTTFKGGGGQDSLVGGTGKDVFFYAKGDAGTTTIANFDFGSNGRAGNDKLKIASGTIGEISTIEGGVQFAMNSGKKGDTSNIGWFNVTSGTPNQVAIKANNTYYWFAKEDIKADDGSDDVLAQAGQLITSDTRVSASDVSGLSVIDLNYSTNLAKAGVAVKVTGAKPTT